MKKFKQLSTHLEGKTRLSPKQLFEVAERVAKQCSQDEALGVFLEKSVTKDGQPVTQRYAIRHDGEPVSALEVWIDMSKGVLPAHSQPFTFYADWGDEVGEQMLGPENRPKGAVRSMAKFASLYVGEMKGYAIYRQYLNALSEAVHAADSDAQVGIKVDR